MFDWLLFLCLLGVSTPGVIVAIPQVLNTVEKTVVSEPPAGQKIPPKPVLIIISISGSLTLIAIAAAVGTAVAYRVDLQTPFFEALVSGGSIWNALRPQIVPALIGGIGGSIFFIAAYYLIFRPRLDDQTVKSMENLRMGLGIWGRILYGGIYEEVLTRWGLMSLLVWLGSLLAGDPTALVVWIAIVISGVLFGLGHLPSHLAAGCQKTPMFLTLAISSNLWAALIFGWLFWQYGLFSAIMAHMLFHIVWLPFDLHFYRRDTQ
ncbi:MAG TPA: CPBP family intramembrane metalloprotease [Dehalococcoidia bacterium]|nr:CPBP family intramembrane metalloprotease [Dehalococcoidia bacterium]